MKLMTKDYIKKAFDAAEQEHQEEEIRKIKQVVQKHLEEIERLSKNKQEVEAQIKVHREILDDLKAGRLDKIEEYLEKDEKARNIALIIVKKVEREYIPLAPWRSPWIVDWAQPQFPSVRYSTNVTAASTSLQPFAGSSLTAMGTTFANFTAGTYTVNDRTINL